ncbi:MAG: hypothetical protein FWH14_01910 [Oscillospiraceae bacterium]|nr:hypothetical protein [Oscillospiraceae bacterium]
MDKYFENQYKRTREFYKEFYYIMILKSPIVIMVKIVTLILILLFVIFFLISEPFSARQFLRIFLAYVFLWSVIFIRYFTEVKYGCKRELKTNNGEFFEVKFTATENEIEISHVNNENKEYIIRVAYDKIKKVIKTNNYCFLISEAKFAHAFKNDSFTHGNLEDFLLFLESKGFKR